MKASRPRRAGIALAAAVLVAAALSGSPWGILADEPELPDWIEVSYADLVDLRQPSHSGEPVGALLRRLDGRGLPSGTERPEDFATHRLLDPLLEPYAFVLSDALDSLGPARGKFFAEVGSLWPPGAEQPAWVELLRARRLLVESDGGGVMRLFLPWGGESGPDEDSSDAALAAYRDAWPVMRHVLEAERRRLAANMSEPPALDVRAYAYRHLPERALFLLGTRPSRQTVVDTRPEGTRPPLDLDGLRRFLDTRLLPEGARIDRDGSLRWLGSQKGAAAEILGRPMELADLAVAYRAVSHGGLAEPYMSLDKGHWPQTSVVNYGGRLRDTALGMVSLLCDIRFKTFSQGVDIRTGSDLRKRVRERFPGFLTHLEHMAYDERSARTSTQQTRLWFYPDEVDLTVSAQGDVLVLRRVRMSAESERFEATPGAASGEVPPWTRATVAAINGEYDLLATFFPEMADLDNVVRLLSLFTWLRHAEARGFTVPDMDALLAVDLPAQPTPRTFPQLLAFNALPQAGTRGEVESLERLDVVEGLDRLNPAYGRPLPAIARYERTVAALDRSNAEQAALLQRLAAVDPSAVAEAALDDATYQSQRLLMHDLVLTTLRGAGRDRVAGRFRQGEKLRVFSVGIGGLDLGMEQVLARAGGASMTLAGAGFGSGATLQGSLAAGAAAESGPRREAGGEPRPEWREDPPGLAQTVMLQHGVGGERLESDQLVRVHGNRFETGPPEGRKGRPAWTLTVYDEDGPDVRSRRVVYDAQRHVVRFERVERMRLLHYRMESKGNRLTARRLETPSAAGEDDADAPAETAPLPAGLALVKVGIKADQRGTSTVVPLRLEADAAGVRRGLDASYPRAELRRLVLGRMVDKTPDRPMSGLEPLPATLGEVETVMVLTEEAGNRPPWIQDPVPLAGEENPLRLAAALDAWWSGGTGGAPRAVVGVDDVVSPRRWDAAPRPGPDALLLVPDEAFPRGSAELASRVRQAWGSGPVADKLPDECEASLIVLVSAEGPSLFASRVRDLAAEPALEGKLLAVWNVSGAATREDLPARLLGDAGLAGLGLAASSFVEARAMPDRLSEIRSALERAGETPLRVERLPGPFLWYF